MGNASTDGRIGDALCHARMFLSGIQIHNWQVTLIEILDSRLKRAGMTRDIQAE
jgi:hypothetical protein